MDQSLTNSTTARKGKVPMSAIMGYGAAALAYNFVYTLVTNFLNIYFTNIMGISLAAVGTIMVVARIWDGVNDPMMGTLVDRTNTKEGRYRPYLKWGIIPLGLMTVLLFTNPDISMELKTIYAGGAYILWGMAYTFANIPYMSMQSTLSFDSNERTKIITLKNIFVMVGIFAAMIGVPALAVGDSDFSQSGFTKVAVIGAVLVAICMWISYKATARFKYIESDSHKSKITFKQRVDAIVKNKPLIIMALSLLILSVFMSLMGAQNYYAMNVLNRPDLIMQFTMAGALPMMLAMVAMPVAMKFEKRTLMGLGMLIFVIGSVAFYFVPASNTGVLSLMLALRSFGTGFAMIVVWSMIADCVDYAALKTGKQQGGIVFSTSTFMQKAAGGIGGGLLNFLLIAFNFNPKIHEQTAEAANGVKMILSLLPAAGAALIIVLMFFYPLTKSKMREIQAQLGR